MTRDRYGSAHVLALSDIDVPVVTDDEVLIRVHAAGVGPDVWHLMTGMPYLVRLTGVGLRKPKIRVLGRDVAGSVEAVGKDVRKFQPGDEVYGTCDGAFAEYVCVRADRVAPKPANLTFEQAAGVPVSACAALHGLRDAGRVQDGQTVLIIGASGGVGTFAVQLARAFGAHVTGVCSTTNADLVQSIGAEHVIAYPQEDFADGARTTT
jgi:NADPH:quinone reductase-like Zn-dependent oxidoreductase